MKTSTTIILSLILIIIIGVVGFRLTGNAVAEPGKYDAFAQCLSDNDVKMYGAYWCPNCEQQKLMFDDSWKKVDYIECSLPQRRGQTQVCIRENIQYYPTWEFTDGSRVSGTLSLQELSARTGCALPN